MFSKFERVQKVFISSNFDKNVFKRIIYYLFLLHQPSYLVNSIFNEYIFIHFCSLLKPYFFALKKLKLLYD